MKIYLVGGAVRDALLNLDVKERDWVVVGSSPEEMLALGYQQVGKDFPVFLHPETRDEYALARTERNTAPGYKGFSISASNKVTLEEDLLRRDLTINAIARDENGELVDPFNGQQDLNDRLLRHVSPAFAEDPVRILRIARFAARFQPLGFRIADETMNLMKSMVAMGEVDALVPERVWQELSRSLALPHARKFIEVLRECGALKVLMPEVEKLFGVPQTAKWHPEIDTGVHTLMVLDQACKAEASVEVRFASLCHDLGKGETPADILPSHHGHEERSARLTAEICKRFRVPNDFRNLAVLTGRFHTHCHRVYELKPDTILKTLGSLDAFRRPERFELFLQACECDARGRSGFEQSPYPQADFFRGALAAASSINTRALAAEGGRGIAIKERIETARLEAIKSWKSANPEPA